MAKNRRPRISGWLGLCAVLLPLAGLAAAPSRFTLATYNLENYLLQDIGMRRAKSDTARARIREAIRQVHPDVLALQEVGGTNALLELREALRLDGLDLPHWELVGGYDTNIQVALLSRLPFAARRPHPNESFLLRGRRFRTTRGFLEVDVQAAPGYRFTLLTAHLKSRRASAAAPQDEIREEEARILRRLVDRHLQRDPEANLVVLGDLNDLKDSAALRILLGRGRLTLVDLRPAESQGEATPSPGVGPGPRRVTWTHFYAQEDAYSRVDYILLSPGMARECDRSDCYVLAWPHWGEASDHRPVVARFHAQDR